MSLKRPKINNLFAPYDCCSPVIKRWSAGVGEGEKVQVRARIESLGRLKQLVYGEALMEHRGPTVLPAATVSSSPASGFRLRWKKKMAQRLSPQPPKPHFQVAIPPPKAAQHTILTRQTDKTPLVASQEGAAVGRR